MYSVAARPPDVGFGRVAARPFDRTWRDSAASSVGYRRYEITNTTAYPFVTHGRLFVTYGASMYFCSATIVTSANESTLATAAHCLYDVEGGGFADAVYFAPGYRLGRAPFGFWPAQRAWIPGQWAAPHRDADDYRYDVGFVYVPPPVGGATLMDAFGSRGISFNRERTSFASFGYPAAPPFDGERLFTCESAAGGVDPFELAPRPNAMGCDMTGGSSGGGWVASGTTLVNSVTSYSYDGEPGVLYGPYFGPVAQAAYQEAAAHGALPAPTQPATPSASPTPSSTPAPSSPAPTPSPSPAPTPSPSPAPTPSPSPTPPPDTLAPYVDALGDRPDPFSPNGDGVKDKTKISWSVSETIPYATVDIYKGNRLVRSLAEGSLEPGGWFVKWAGRNDSGAKVTNGRYRYVIRVEDEAGNARVATGQTTVRR